MKTKKRAIQVREEREPILQGIQAPLDDKGRISEVRMSMEELEIHLKRSGMKTKSASIRLLWNMNYSRAAIAKFLGIRYQHVRNVLTKELKRGPQVVSKPEETSNSDTVVVDEGSTVSDE